MYRTRQLPSRQIAIVNLVAALGLSCFSALADAPIRYGKAFSQSYQANVSQKTTKLKQYAMNTSAVDDNFFYPDEIVGPRRVAAAVERPQTKAHTKLDFTPKSSGCSVDPIAYRSYMKIGKPYEIMGVKYTPAEDPFYNKTGTASWYGPQFHGKKTANGETFDMMDMTAAHPTLPLPSYVLVENLQNGRSVVVRVNDRGPFKKNRLIDLSKAAAAKLDVIKHGTAQVRVEYLGPAEKAGTSAGDCTQLHQAKAKNVRKEVPAKILKAAISDYHFVQIGSFANQTNAKSLLSQAKSVYNRGDVVFANVSGNGRYRVVLGPFKTRDTASSTLSLLKSNGFDGLVVKNPS